MTNYENCGEVKVEKVKFGIESEKSDPEIVGLIKRLEEVEGKVEVSEAHLDDIKRRQQARYAYEQKVAAVRAVVEDGMTRPAATAEFGIMPMVPLDRWCRLYR